MDNSRRAAVAMGLTMSLLTGAARVAMAEQAPTEGGVSLTIVVRVPVDRTERGLPGILVSVNGLRTGIVRTDASGKARFPDRPLGPYVVRVTAVGYAPVEERLELTLAGEFELPLLLVTAPDAQLLPTVVRTARRSPAPGFDARRATGRGHVFDRHAIDSLAPRLTSDLLRRVPSVRLVGSGGGFVPRTRRSSGMSDCPMSIYLDGVQIDDERGAPPAPPIGQSARGGRAAPPSVIDGIAVDLLEAVEVFVGASEIPSQFNQAGGSCGVIALWTRAKR